MFDRQRDAPLQLHMHDIVGTTVVWSTRWTVLCGASETVLDTHMVVIEHYCAFQQSRRFEQLMANAWFMGWLVAG
jgi:hypothetical protein